jgi:hypothetical protein
MPTLQEVRRAIYWGERWLSKFYREIQWGGKTYGIVSETIATPLSITMATKPSPPYGYADYTNRNWLAAGFGVISPWIQCGVGPTWEPDAVISTTSNNGETWDGYLTFYYYFQHGLHPEEIISQEILKLHVRYGPSPADPKRMRIEITPESARLDLGLSLWLNFTQTQGGTKCILSSMGNTDIGRTLVYDTEQYGCFPGNIYTTRTASELYTLYGWFDAPALREKAKKVKIFLDDYGFKPEYYAASNYYRLTDGLGDFVMSTGDYGHDAAVWDILPKGPGFVPYWSKANYCPTYANQMWYALYDIRNAVHFMNKYKDPYHKVTFVYVTETFGKTFASHSAYDILIAGGYTLKPTTLQIEAYPVAAKDGFEPGKGFRIEGYDAYTRGWLGAFTELGYGFGVEEAKTLADQIADVYIKAQWGYPFTPGEEGYGHSFTHNTVNRPDNTGAFIATWKVISGSEIFAETAIPHTSWTDFIAELLNVNPSPSESAIYIPFGSACEKTISALADLRAYEFYKWRLPK